MKCSPVDQVLSLCFTQNVPFLGWKRLQKSQLSSTFFVERPGPWKNVFFLFDFKEILVEPTVAKELYLAIQIWAPGQQLGVFWIVFWEILHQWTVFRSKTSRPNKNMVTNLKICTKKSCILTNSLRGLFNIYRFQVAKGSQWEIHLPSFLWREPYYTPPKFNSSPLKTDGWKTRISFWGPGAFAGKLHECNLHGIHCCSV